MKKLGLVAAALVLALTLVLVGSARSRAPQKEPLSASKKIGVILVSHGSRSETWRNALLGLEQRVRGRILASGRIADVKTAFMEYTEPSIATRLKELDAAGFSDVILVPIFLTVSPHTFDDIPTILGMKDDPQSAETLKIEKIERYTPKAKAHLTPPLDFPDILRGNVLARVRALSKDPRNEGLVLIAYGDQTYERQWAELLSAVGDHVKDSAGIASYSYGWCGHVAHYDPNETTKAIEKVLSVEQTAIVIPVLVAYDEMFQIKIIGDGIAKIEGSKTRVVYKPDSILPDPNVEKWVVGATAEYADRIHGR
jgi:hypothetical protein